MMQAEAQRFGSDEMVAQAMQGKTRVVHGLQVGRLFLRAAFADERYQDILTGDILRADGLWCIDVVGTAVTVGYYASLSTALMVADDVSRFCPALEAASTDDEALGATDGEVDEWLESTVQDEEAGRKPKPFREWLHSRSGADRGHEMEAGGP